ncbi:MAG: patatin-like phospholipase family protein [Alicyclobacillus sp.]|nr:patatin-like phospholipase family protein [Alicyclobacillus sp.]
MNYEATRIGVALCGAELYGTVHAGVLFGLEFIGVKPHIVAGSSAGALIASLYAHGYSMDAFCTFIAEFPGLRMLDYGFPLISSLLNLARHKWQGKNVPIPRGVFSGERLQDYIRRVHKNRLPKMPFYIVATDLYTTNAVAFTNDSDAVKQGYAQQSTDLNKEIAGSCSLPGVFTPIRHRNWVLVDGGVRDRVPVSILRQAGCDKIIAVNIHQLTAAWYPVTVVDVIQRSLATVLDEASDTSDLAGDDVFVIKPDLSRTSWWSCREPMMRNMDLGYQYVLSRRANILNFLNSRY